MIVVNHDFKEFVRERSNIKNLHNITVTKTGAIIFKVALIKRYQLEDFKHVKFFVYDKKIRIEFLDKPETNTYAVTKYKNGSYVVRCRLILKEVGANTNYTSKYKLRVLKDIKNCFEVDFNEKQE